MTLFSMSLPHIFGQGTPTTVQGPLPNLGNLEFEEQKAIIIVEPPEGFQASSGSQFSSGNSDLLNNIISALTGGGIGGGISGLYAKIRGDKNEKTTEAVKQTTQDVAQNQVKIAEVQQGTLEQVFEISPNKGNDITNKPVIKQENVEKIKEKAIETASKS